MKRQPSPGAVCTRDAAAVGLDDRLGDAQAQAAAAGAAGARRVAAVEAFEHVGRGVGVQARAVVDDLDDDGAVAVGRPTSSIGVSAGVCTSALCTTAATTWCMPQRVAVARERRSVTAR